ncbi:MAG: DUF1893 domain-containing protein [candidate division Zixibacteria bacterium]|nr:DUF1893 domain-containing protein [candidate division Zixibacteria bacterium]
MYTLDEFLASGWSLVVYADDDLVYRSKDSDLIPLLDFLDRDRESSLRLTIFDRYIGRAAALLMVLIQPQRVCAGVLSEGGAIVLRENKVPFEAVRQVKYLMDIASEGMCRWEKAAQHRTPEEWWQAVKVMKEQDEKTR